MKRAVLLLMCIAVFPFPLHAESFRARVESVVESGRGPLTGTDLIQETQLLQATLPDGTEILLENDRLVLGPGDYAFVERADLPDGERWFAVEYDRRGALLAIVIVGAGLVLWLGQSQGARAILSLGVSLALVVFGLLPFLAAGWPPVATSVLFSMCILAIAMFVTHGPNRGTLAAYIAAVIAVSFAGLLGEASILLTHLSGFTDDTSAILHLTTAGVLNMEGLLLAAMIIGTLGIVDDITITQVATVGELKAANQRLSRRELYTRAMRVGVEHLAAVVNTLFLAYVGAALPLLLLFTLSPAPASFLLNSEILATEVVRAAVGTMALVIAVPLSTWCGILLGGHGLTHAHK